MKIAVIGAGMIGATVARLFAQADHEVSISNSRGPESLASLVAELGPRARAMTVTDAARWAEVVMLAVPFRTPAALPPADALAGKIVIDAMNPYGPDGKVMDLGASSSSEETRARLPGARLVKAFNTIWFKHLSERAAPDRRADDRHAIFVAGDDEAAKRVVINLIDDIGFGAVDSGSLAQGGRLQQPDGPLYNKVMTAREGRDAVARART
jgi:8-hydroxy-5-deazaflavin:NADPH oxidoreductase